MKYCCDIEGLEDNFIEMSDSWSRKEVRVLWDLQGAEYMALLQSKLISCRLTRPGDEPLTEPTAFLEEVADTLDWRIWRWLSSVPTKHVQSVGELGEASGRRLFVSTETNSEPASDAP